MSNLTLTSNQETITSIEVAQMINKEHAKLLRDIRRYINQIKKINENSNQSKIGFVDFFIDATYTDSKNKIRPCYNIIHKGCEFIANKLTGIKGTEFTTRYVNRFHELEENNTINSLVITMKTISDTMLEIQRTTNERIDKLEETIKSSQTQKKSLSTKVHSRWKTNISNKLKILTDYANEHSDQELTLSDTLHITINKMQDTYDIELSDYTRDYMLENSSEIKPYDLDVINYYKELRNMYSLVIDSILERLNLNAESLSQNIFDRLANAL